jgi:hypothetical protein
MIIEHGQSRSCHLLEFLPTSLRQALGSANKAAARAGEHTASRSADKNQALPGSFSTRVLRVLCLVLMATAVDIAASSWLLASAGVLVGFFVWRELSSRAQCRRRPLPPGPPGWPIIGNVLDVPSRDEHVKYAELSKKYGAYPSIDIAMDPDEHSGDVVYMDAGGQPMVILGSQRAAIELFERRGAIYSSRPKSHMLDMCVRLDIRRFSANPAEAGAAPGCTSLPSHTAKSGAPDARRFTRRTSQSTLSSITPISWLLCTRSCRVCRRIRKTCSSSADSAPQNPRLVPRRS